jgi:ATP-dependent helicase STH1/SNF2
MQEQGVRHDDPEYLKAHNLLAAVQRQQAFQKQRHFQQQQQLQAQRQQQLNGTGQDSAGPNGINSKAYYIIL